jgi:cysteine sulfinate desulfinase/cysteine desulfurase-like protein
MAIKASFSPNAALLSVTGAQAASTITMSRDADILVNGGAECEHAHICRASAALQAHM